MGSADSTIIDGDIVALLKLAGNAGNDTSVVSGGMVRHKELV